MWADSTKEILKFYINGELADDHVYDVYSSQYLASVHRTYQDRKRKDSDFGPPALPTFGGTMDDVRLYNRPLTAAEVLALYQVNGNVRRLIHRGVSEGCCSCGGSRVSTLPPASSSGSSSSRPDQCQLHQSGLGGRPWRQDQHSAEGASPKRTKSATRDSDTWIPVHPLLGSTH